VHEKFRERASRAVVERRNLQSVFEKEFAELFANGNGLIAVDVGDVSGSGCRGDFLAVPVFRIFHRTRGWCAICAFLQRTADV
jgi:hypothetical protein